MKRLKIKDINSYSDSGEKKELALHGILNLIIGGVDGLIVHLINTNVDNEVIRIIGIALFGLRGLSRGIAALIYGGVLGYCVYEDIKDNIEENRVK